MLDPKDWISERQTAGTILGLKVTKWLVRRKTKYQMLELALTEEYGLAFALDGCFMLTERDEFFYHEMLVHPALLSLPEPGSVLVVGGGDGGALREVLKHPSVKRAVLVEIDEEVVKAAQKHLASVHQGSFYDERAQVVISPGEEYVKRWEAEFDAIIVDSTDPVGPGRRLFEPEFFASCRRALKDEGVMALQAGTPFHHPEELTSTLLTLGKLFGAVKPYLGFVPTYPSGMWAYILTGTQRIEFDKDLIERRYRERNLQTRYYTPELHFAAFVLPRFVQEMVEKAL